jgi:hypothetical protein
MDVHVKGMLNCVGVKNYIYSVVYGLSNLAVVPIFLYLVWTHLLGLKDTPTPSRSCVLPHAVCKLISADIFLVSVAVWSVLQNLLGIIILELRRHCWLDADT